jgi:hypothetical protein
MQQRTTRAALFDVVAYAVAVVELLAVFVWLWDASVPVRSTLLYDFGQSYYAFGLALMILAGVGIAVLWPAVRSAYFGYAGWRRSATCLAVTTVLLLLQLAYMAFLGVALSGPMMP